MKYILFLGFFILNACTVIRYYNLEEFNANFSKQLQLIAENNAKLDSYQANLNKISESIKNAAELSSIYQGISAQNNSINQIKNDSNDLKSFYIKSPYSKFKKLSSTDKEYADFPNFQSDLNAKFLSLKNKYELAFKQNENLNSEIKKANLYFIESDKVLTTISSELKNFQVKLKEFKTNLQNENAKNLPNMNEIQNEVNIISSLAFDLENYYNEVKSELENHKEVIILPGMKSHRYIDKINSFSEQINAHTESINKYLKNELSKK